MLNIKKSKNPKTIYRHNLCDNLCYRLSGVHF